ncbi:hypothetical protein CC86DRAFT_463756 [Ophiobolus disseminans]|uniref:Uncharacterized protein n=1 Tax=Ophiobolus disseminans TaxID=1469910 RepID=A0A6A7ACY9_9PLEO|nr:hypothetical protein CC86DRAFT_463756 [Ophiobolus disseminans]
MSSKATKSRASKAISETRLPFSPLRGICVRNIYKHDKNFEASHQPWTRQQDLGLGIGIEAIDADEKGFLTGQKLKKHKMSIINGKYNGIFPKCWGYGTSSIENSALWPQNGDLRSRLHSPKSPKMEDALRYWREELNQKMYGKDEKEKKTKDLWMWIRDPDQKHKRVVKGGVVIQKAEPNQTAAAAIERKLEAIEAQRKVRRDERRQRMKKIDLDAMWVELEGVRESER